MGTGRPARPRSFAGTLRSFRTAAGLSQQELAERAGLSTAAVSALERGSRRRPHPHTVRALSAALGLTPGEHARLIESIVPADAGDGHVDLGVAHLLALPVPVPRLVGREVELIAACRAFRESDVRLLTLTGPPGVGKTRLALAIVSELAGDFPDAVSVVPLASVAEPDLVAPAIRLALGVPGASDKTAIESIAASLGRRPALILLDNFEHVDRAAPVLVELLAARAEVRLLVTSRRPLQVRAERELRVPPLRLPHAAADPSELMGVPSVAVFVERAGNFQLTPRNAGWVAAICRRLDGLPLALELAAPWVRLLTPDQLLDRLDTVLSLPQAGARDLPERQRTLDATLAWSCDLLEPAQRALLRRLAVFAGSASLDAVEAVCQAAGMLPSGTLPALSVLVDHGLVQRAQWSDGDGRVLLLQTVRQYASRLLDAAGERELTALAHAGHCAALAERADRGLEGRSRVHGWTGWSASTTTCGRPCGGPPPPAGSSWGSGSAPGWGSSGRAAGTRERGSPGWSACSASARRPPSRPRSAPRRSGRPASWPGPRARSTWRSAGSGRASRSRARCTIVAQWPMRSVASARR